MPMKKSKFFASVNDAKRFLKGLGLLKDSLARQKPLSAEFFRCSHSSDYASTYDCAVRNVDYDFILNDESIFQFDYLSEVDIRYAFLQCPYVIEPFSDWLESSDRYDDELSREEYELQTEDAPNRMSPVSLRYEYCPKLYTPAIHAASHIHVGHQTDMRLPVSEILTPHIFVSFVVKHTYLGHWKKCFSDTEWPDKMHRLKASCGDVEKAYFGKPDKGELYFV